MTSCPECVGLQMGLHGSATLAEASVGVGSAAACYLAGLLALMVVKPFGALWEP
jgi:hypothetical protein